MPIELSQLEDELPLIDVPVQFDDDGKPSAGFKVCGSNSQEYRDAVQDASAKMIQMSARRGRAVQLVSDEGSKLAASGQTLERLEVAVACTKQSYGFTDGGVETQFDEKQRRALFSKWIEWRDLVWSAVKREANFTKSSPAS